MVTSEQWKYIHQELATWEPEHVLLLIHPSKGLTMRVVNTSFPEENGHINVKIEHKTREDIADALKGSKEGYNAYHPGYTFSMVSGMTPGLTRHFDGQKRDDRVRMKGTMLYWDEVINWKARLSVVSYSKGAASRFRHDLKRFSPMTYITVFCDGRRIWLSELSSDWPAE